MSLILIMRLVHIISGVTWAGGAFMLTTIVTPAVQASGPAGGQVMQQITGPRKLSGYLTAVAILTTLSGLYLFDVRSNHFNMEWISSSAGIMLSIGALAGVAAFLHGAFVTGRLTRKASELGKELAASQGPPPPEKLAAMAELQRKLVLNGRISAILLLIAVGGMSVTGYV